jgi:undecaprenyl-diphosphatase
LSFDRCRDGTAPLCSELHVFPTLFNFYTVYFWLNMNLEKLLRIDYDISHSLRVAEKPGPLRKIALLIGHSGDSWFWAAGLLLVIFLGTPAYRYWALVSLIAVLVGAITVLIIKFTIKRSRPEGDMGQIYRKTDPHSFPSGHAVRSLMLGVIALGIAPPWLGIVLIIWGPMVGIARVAIGVHYVSDVLAGWLLGLLFGLGAIWLSTQWL